MDSSDEDSSSSGCSDVESSDDEEDEDMMEESIPNDKPVDDDSDSDSDSMDDKDFLSMFGPDGKYIVFLFRGNFEGRRSLHFDTKFESYGLMFSFWTKAWNEQCRCFNF